MIGGLTTGAIAQVPATDPTVPTGQRIPLVPSVVDQHPRLLFTSSQLAEIKTNALKPGNPFYTQLTSYLMSPPSNNNYVSNDTEAQRQGFWRAPSVALHYAITNDNNSFTKAKGYLDSFLAQPQWQTGQEDDSGMGAGNIMLGAALAYDMLYNDLTPAYRDQFRTKLLDQARKMYYLGHMQLNSDSHYWQQDPQNNHRWHRDGGLALAVLAVADSNDPNDEWILQQVKKELDFISQWMPKDGSNHEGTQYASFGSNHITLAFDAADRVLGTNYLDNVFYKKAADFRIATLTPGFSKTFAFGDASVNALGSTNNYLFLATAHNGQADQQAALMRLYNQDQSTFEFGWMSVLWHDPSLDDGSINNLPKKHKFDDIGLAVVRDGWESNNVGMSFKSSPYGGASLNEYRNANGYHYINVAHDDPDANSFQIYARGQMIVQPDAYADVKRTSSHNTILFNGAGQKGEGGQWSQPLGGADKDMTKLARMTWYEDRGNITIAEGEAGGAYNGLSRYRRTTAFNEGKYIIVLDDIRAPSAGAVTWMVQSGEVTAIDAANGRFNLRADGVDMPFILEGNVDFAWQVVDSTAEHRGTPLGLKQFRATATTAQWRTAALFDAWGLNGITLDFVEISPLVSEIHITGPGFSDVWLWDSTGEQTILTLVPEPGLIAGFACFAPLLMRRRV